MAYRIDPRVPVEVEIRRVLREQLDGAIADLRVPGGPDAAAVHSARRQIKKARSAVRLGRSLVGPAVAREANAELREVASSIATQRDADALVEAVDRLLSEISADDPARPAFDRLRQRCADAADSQRASGSIDVSTAHGAARQLQQTSDWLQRVPARTHGWAGIELGLRREYARGRSQLAQLGSAPSDEERHDWRKRAKDLWYHERLLRDLWPKVQKPYVRTASDLADRLGEDHDLTLLQAFVVTGEAFGDAAVEVLTKALDSRQDALLAEALALGALLYADRPDAWVARHRAWWEIRTAADQARSPGTA